MGIDMDQTCTRRRIPAAPRCDRMSAGLTAQLAGRSSSSGRVFAFVVIWLAAGGAVASLVASCSQVRTIERFSQPVATQPIRGPVRPLAVQTPRPWESAAIGPGSAQPATLAERETRLTTFFDWTGPTATEAYTRKKPQTLGPQGVTSEGGRWSWLDSMGSWLTKGTAIGLGFGLLGLLGLLAIPTTRSAGVGILRFLGWLVPLVGGALESLRGRGHASRFREVVAGGEAFRAKLGQLGLPPSDVARIWGVFTEAQKSAQSAKTKREVDKVTKMGGGA